MAFKALEAGGYRGAAPRVVATLDELARGDAIVMRHLLSSLTAAQRTGRSRLPNPLPTVDGMRSVFRTAEFAPAERRVLLIAALSVSDSASTLLAAAAVDIKVIVIGPLREQLRFSQGRFAFADPRVRDTVVADASSPDLREAHQSLSRAHRKHSTLSQSAWHEVRAGSPLKPRTAEILLRFADELAAAGNSLAAHDVCVQIATRATGDLRDRALLSAARAALWAGLVDDAATHLSDMSREAVASAPAKTTARALESIRTGAIEGGDAREGSIDAIDPLLAATMSATDRVLLADIRELVATSLRGELREADGMGARLRLATATTPRYWPWSTEHPAPSPLAYAHVILLKAAFEMRTKEFDGAWATLVDGARRLPLEHAGTGIVVSLIRLVALRAGHGSGIADALDDLSHGPKLHYDPQRLTVSDLSSAASKAWPPEDNATPAPLDREELLTRRESEVVSLVVRGLSNRGIADELGLSPRTVEVHLVRIYRKLEVSSRSRLIAKFAGLDI